MHVSRPIYFFLIVFSRHVLVLNMGTQKTNISGANKIRSFFFRLCWHLQGTADFKRLIASFHPAEKCLWRWKSRKKVSLISTVFKRSRMHASANLSPTHCPIESSKESPAYGSGTWPNEENLGYISLTRGYLLYFRITCPYFKSENSRKQFKGAGNFFLIPKEKLLSKGNTGRPLPHPIIMSPE